MDNLTSMFASKSNDSGSPFDSPDKSSGSAFGSAFGGSKSSKSAFDIGGSKKKSLFDGPSEGMGGKSPFEAKSPFDKAGQKDQSPFGVSNPFGGIGDEMSSGSFFDKEIKNTEISKVEQSRSGGQSFDMEVKGTFASTSNDQYGNGMNGDYEDKNSISGQMNIRAKNMENLSLIDAARGQQARRIDNDGGEVSIAEMYNDSSLDTRVGGGQYNVTISDIYTKKELYMGFHGLNTDGHISAQDEAAEFKAVDQMIVNENADAMSMYEIKNEKHISDFFKEKDVSGIPDSAFSAYEIKQANENESITSMFEGKVIAENDLESNIWGGNKSNESSDSAFGGSAFNSDSEFTAKNEVYSGMFSSILSNDSKESVDATAGVSLFAAAAIGSGLDSDSIKKNEPNVNDIRNETDRTLSKLNDIQNDVDRKTKEVRDLVEIARLATIRANEEQTEESRIAAANASQRANEAISESERLINEFNAVLNSSTDVIASTKTLSQDISDDTSRNVELSNIDNIERSIMTMKDMAMSNSNELSLSGMMIGSLAVIVEQVSSNSINGTANNSENTENKTGPNAGPSTGDATPDPAAVAAAAVADAKAKAAAADAALLLAATNAKKAAELSVEKTNIAKKAVEDAKAAADEANSLAMKAENNTSEYAGKIAITAAKKANKLLKEAEKALEKAKEITDESLKVSTMAMGMINSGGTMAAKTVAKTIIDSTLKTSNENKVEVEAGVDNRKNSIQEMSLNADNIRKIKGKKKSAEKQAEAKISADKEAEADADREPKAVGVEDAPKTPDDIAKEEAKKAESKDSTTSDTSSSGSQNRQIIAGGVGYSSDHIGVAKEKKDFLSLIESKSDNEAKIVSNILATGVETSIPELVMLDRPNDESVVIDLIKDAEISVSGGFAGMAAAAGLVSETEESIDENGNKIYVRKKTLQEGNLVESISDMKSFTKQEAKYDYSLGIDDSLIDDFVINVGPYHKKVSEYTIDELIEIRRYIDANNHGSDHNLLDETKKRIVKVILKKSF